MRAEELVMEGHRAPVAEFELVRAEVGKARRWAVLSSERARVQVQREGAHLARAPEEGVPAHRRQLLQPALLAPLVLEPDLKSRRGRRPGAFNQLELFNGILRPYLLYFQARGGRSIIKISALDSAQLVGLLLFIQTLTFVRVFAFSLSHSYHLTSRGDIIITCLLIIMLFLGEYHYYVLNCKLNYLSPPLSLSRVEYIIRRLSLSP